MNKQEQTRLIKEIRSGLNTLEQKAETIAPGNIAHARANIITSIRYNRLLLNKLEHVSSKRVFISGKITGLDRHIVIENFVKAAIEFRKYGIEVVNPVEIITEDIPWEEAMRICLAELSKCTHIHQLANWQDSAGALFEWEMAVKLNIERIFIEDLKPEIYAK